MNLGKHLEYLFVPHELTYGMVLNCGDPAGVGSGSGVSTSIIIYIGVCGNFRHVSETCRLERSTFMSQSQRLQAKV